ncbi:hypothetical protein [Inquilinus sp. CA228]|uniref:hypothetical protein n=1 Tax=Inquilinus sp. CA228 TaxID=3455609 RepID=UPI003F8D2676
MTFLILPKPVGLKMTTEMWRIDARTRSGGETITGREQIVHSGLGRWVADVTFAAHDPASIRLLRALVAKLQGRLNAVSIGPCDCFSAPDSVPLVHGIPYDDQSFHTDGAGFVQGGTPPVVIEEVTNIQALAGAYSVKIMIGSTIAPIPEGVYIGLTGRLYMVVGYTELENETAQLDLLPRIRPSTSDPTVAIPVDETVLWCGARCPMRLATDDSGSLQLQLARYGTATLSMVEANF